MELSSLHRFIDRVLFAFEPDEGSEVAADVGSDSDVALENVEMDDSSIESVSEETGDIHRSSTRAWTLGERSSFRGCVQSIVSIVCPRSVKWGVVSPVWGLLGGSALFWLVFDGLVRYRLSFGCLRLRLLFCSDSSRPRPSSEYDPLSLNKM